MAESTIPFPPQFASSLASAIRTQTNALLEIKASLALIAERIDRIVDAERTEADDIREIRRAVIGTAHEISEAHHNIRETRKELEELSGEHEALDTVREPGGVIDAVGVIAARMQKLPVWLRILAGTSIGGALVEAAHKFLHF